MHEGSRKAIIAAVIANGGIAVAKFVGFAVTGAASMMAEAIHSVADTSNQGLLLFGGKRSRRRATAQHQFGYGRERYFWAFVVAVVLFTLGSIFALYEGIEKLRHPHEIESPEWAIGILVVAIGLESFSLRTAVRESRTAKGQGSWWGFIRHSRNPELPVVLLEDIGALFGLVFALTGVLLAMATNEPRYDAMGSVAIGLLLGVIAIVLAIEMKSLIIGESATTRDERAIREAIEGSPRVVRIIHMRTEHVGPDELLVAAKVEFDAATSMAELVAAINATEAAIRDRLPIARLIYLEPDLYQASTS